MTNATAVAIDLAGEHGLDISTITGTGHNGKVTKADVEAALAGLTGEPPSIETLVRQSLSSGMTTTEVADKLDLSHALVIYHARVKR